MEKSKKKNSLIFVVASIFFIVIFIVFTVMLVSGLKERSTESTTEPLKPKSPYWVARKSTGLYAKAEMDSDLTEILSVGDIVVIPDGKASLTCTQVIDIEFDEELCYVQVYPNGELGWVMIKWFNKR